MLSSVLNDFVFSIWYEYTPSHNPTISISEDNGIGELSDKVNIHTESQKTLGYITS
jgi:hypothetical protein